MNIRSLTELVACDTCYTILHQQAAQEVTVIVKGNAGGRKHYCHVHTVPYDQHTTTSGYDRYYRNGQEVTEAGQTMRYARSYRR